MRPLNSPGSDMTSPELGDMLSPAPTYSSTFDSQDISDMPRHNSFSIMSKSNTPWDTYHQSTKQEPPPVFESWDKIRLEDGEGLRVKPDYLDSNHPQYARSAQPELVTTRPERRRLPAKRILIPWALFVIFFLITVWYTSILFGARFLSIIRPVPSNLAAQEINIYIHGELVQGTVSVSTRSFAALTSTTPIVSQAPSPTTSPPSDKNESPDVGNLLGRVSLGAGSTMVAPVPTGFVTTTRGIF
ncbi:hypothetical protein yc1106_08314 [Curvularia clavata]|uniref:Uncharacterized protein n=1 Tax=Curvularia clavata TaxID=95742 RepID=A0A9Q9DWJ7_CURCL|nr:hypothetical protein yc1106_08314 [Curvularia clavata]